MNPETIKVLIIDDNLRDAELELMELRRAGIAVDGMVVSNEPELRAAIGSFPADVILCDSSFPDFDGATAQRILKSVASETPLIIVSGTLSEDRAVLALRAGALDYVLKNSLARLPSAVQRAVQETRERIRLERSLRSFEKRTRHQAQRLEVLWRIVNSSNLSGQALISAMLNEAAGAMRPEEPYFAVLGHVVGNDYLFDAAAGELGAVDSPLRDAVRIGRRVPVHETIHARDLSTTRTRSWDDVQALPDLSPQRRALGIRGQIATHFVACGTTYVLTIASLAPPSATPFGPEDHAYVEILAASFANQLQLSELQASLRSEEERSRRHAERLEALWRIVNDAALRLEERWVAMLREAAAAIRVGQGFQGSLWRVDETELIIEAVTEPSPSLPGALAMRPGDVLPIEGGVVHQLLVEGGRTQAWDDLHASGWASPLARQMGTRALIATTFTAGGTTWGVSFASTIPSLYPFGPEDKAYVEVLASFFANNVQQRWQFDRIAYQQSHDVLTGLLNRSQFRSQARAAARNCERYAIVLIDIDALREINESYGYMIGDALLVEVGNALRQRASTSEFVGRVGGDVFGIFIPNPISKEFVRARSIDFAEVFARAFSTGDREGKEFVALTASLGIAMAPEDGAAIDAILSHADAALLVAKGQGHGSVVAYEAGMEGDAQRRATLRNELMEALAHDQFELYFQPHVELASGSVTGCEALLRWNHPMRGLVGPGHFIPFAEETGVITGIDAWVMRNAFAASKDLTATRSGFRLYFNLSGRQAGDTKIVRFFTDAARNGVALEGIGVEITESDAMRDVEATRRVCRALRRLNVRIAIDDFGTGYSSLSSLKRLPVDIVKIDQSFVAGLLDDPHDQTIAETIISISKCFGFDSLGEGAEQTGQVNWLRDRSCRYAQGFVICRPLPLAAFKAWLEGRT